MVSNRHFSPVVLAFSLLLTACGGSSSSDSPSSATVAKGEANEYTGSTSAAELPSTEEGKRALAEAVVQTFKVKNIPLLRAEEFGEDIIQSEATCVAGTTSYQAKIEEEYDEEYDELFEDIVKADVAFNNCDGTIGNGRKGVFNGELDYRTQETKTSATDSYGFKKLSIEEESYQGHAQHLFNGEYLSIFKLRSDGDIDITQSWNFGITYTNPSETIEFKSLGKQVHAADFDEDEALSSALFEASFTFSETTYLLKYETLEPYQNLPRLNKIKFYEPELGYYNLDTTGLSGTSCSKDGKLFAGLSGQILIKDDSGAQLLAIMPSCDGVTFQ